MTDSEALEVLGYLLGHEKAVDSGELGDVHNHLNSQEQEALKVILSEFRELKEKAKAKPIKGRKFIEAICPHCESEIFDTYWAFGGIHYCTTCGSAIDWSEGKE